MCDIESIINRMIYATGADNAAQMLAIAGFSSGSAGNWRRRKNIPEGSLARVATKAGVEIEWLKTGEGKQWSAVPPRYLEYFSLTPEEASAADKELKALPGRARNPVTKEQQHLLDIWEKASDFAKKHAMAMLEESAQESREKGDGGSNSAAQNSA